jgi:hypothetical protein
MNKKNIFRPLVVTLALLCIPLVLQLTLGTGIDGDGFNWTGSDFFVAGLLMFVAGLALEWVIVKTSSKWKRALLVTAVFGGFVYIWAEMAVGIFTNWGS